MTDEDKQAGAREFDLKQADEILDEYPKPYSIIDEGNLFYAAREYKLAFEAEQIKRIEAEAELERFCCHGKNPHDCDYSACAGTEGYTAKEWVLVEERDELRQKLEAAESKRSELSEWNKTLHRELDNRSKSLVAMMEKRDALVLENELLRKEVAVIRHHVGLVFALANTRHIRARLDKALAQADAIKKQREELK